MNAVGKIAWREKSIATGIHFLVTLVLAACAAALVFLVWFPDPFQTMIGGTELFVLVVGCDLVLGPLISLVIYNSRKSRRKLVIDYVIVGILQIAALVYGVSVLAGSRPVFVAFSVDRIEIVTAREITDKELAAVVRPEFAKLSFTGPRLVGIDVPRADLTDAMFQAMNGNDIYLRPKFFVPFDLEARRHPQARQAHGCPHGAKARHQAADRSRHARYRTTRGANPLGTRTSQQGVLDRAHRHRERQAPPIHRLRSVLIGASG